MFGWLVKKRLDAFQKSYDYDVDYLRDMYAASPRAFWKFAKLQSVSSHHEDVPPDALFAAKLAATMGEDCGPCTQLEVTMAERAGVKPETLRAIVSGNAAAMPENAALAWNFAQAVMARDIAQSDQLREKIIDRWGRRALVSLALAVASTRVFPTLKYALGHGRACSRVRVAGTELAVKGEAPAARSAGC